MAEQDVSQTSTALAEHRPPAPAVAAPAPSVPGMMSPDEIQQRFRVAAALHQSGLYKDVGSAEQAFAKLVVGRSLGLNEAQSLSLYAMEGKIEVPASMMAGWVRQRGLGYEVEWREGDAWVVEQTGEATVTACRVRILDDGGVPRGAAVFSLADAASAGLVKPKSGWEKFPRNMLYARAMSNAVRWYAPECLAGLPVYTEGEIERTPNLAEGQGNGDEPGWGSVPIAAVHEIEKIIRRAEKLGHAGLASRSAPQQLLDKQGDDVIANWIQQASSELDALQAKAQVERGEREAGERVPDAERVEGAQRLSREGDSVTITGTTTVEEDGTPGETATDSVEVHKADPVLEPDGSTSWQEKNANLDPAVQLELAEARLAGALNEDEEREALEELRRLRGEG